MVIGVRRDGRRSTEWESPAVRTSQGRAATVVRVCIAQLYSEAFATVDANTATRCLSPNERARYCFRCPRCGRRTISGVRAVAASGIARIFNAARRDDPPGDGTMHLDHGPLRSAHTWRRRRGGLGDRLARGSRCRALAKPNRETGAKEHVLPGTRRSGKLALTAAIHRHRGIAEPDQPERHTDIEIDAR